MNTLRDERTPVVVFMILTFAISWSAWGVVVASRAGYASGINLALFLLGGFGPAIAALLMRLVFGRRPAPPVVGAVRRPVVFWMPLALLLGAGPSLVAALVGSAFGEGPIASVTAQIIAGYGGLVPAILVLMVAGPLSEEPGWRGFAYPRIRRRFSRLQTATLLGLIWAAWHLPLFFIGGTSQNETGLWTVGFVFFIVSCLPQTYLLGHVYERGGVAAAVALHFALNASAVLLQVSQPVENLIALTVTAGLVVFAERRLRRDKSVSTAYS